MINDLAFFFAAPAAAAVIYLLYRTFEQEWINLTTEEIYKLWDTNAEKFGNVEEFARALERAIQEKNP
jgi:hypothetical protein